ncbi:hypothetical protein [Sphingomonas bacterium]|uniref:hypothetical protein n=1 Tax=Sphingomonas bacterium TaxID=1895847 RepID=UPI001575F60F|nr:hypothetical protein [Sphingomonas bacterium]
MRPAAASAGCLAILLAATSAPAAPPPAPVYVVDRMRDLISPDEVVGTRRAGLMCLPNGTIRWKDIPQGDALDRREIIQDVLEDEGQHVASLGGTVAARRQVRIRGVVRAAAFRLCARQWLGDRGALSGDAHLEMEWRAENGDGADPGLRHVSTIDRHFDGKQAASLGTLFRAMLEASARDLVQWLGTARTSERSR